MEHVKKYSSLLERDLAISEVRVMALKMYSGKELNDREIETVKRVQYSLQHALDTAQPLAELTSEHVPDDDIRNVLKEAFATNDYSEAPFDSRIIPYVNKVVNRLEILIDNKALTKESSLELISDFEKIQVPTLMFEDL